MLVVKVTTETGYNGSVGDRAFLSDISDVIFQYFRRLGLENVSGIADIRYTRVRHRQ